MALVFAIYAVSLTESTVVNVIAFCVSVFYIVMDLANLNPALQAYDTPSDGWKVRAAWRRLRTKKQG